MTTEDHVSTPSPDHQHSPDDRAEPANPADHIVVPEPGPTFAELGVRPETVEALAAAGIIHTFAIQEYALPIALRGADVIGQAPTGTGKTLGFGVPLLQRIVAPGELADLDLDEDDDRDGHERDGRERPASRDDYDGSPQALVVLPTRELGLQVARDIAVAGKTRGVRVLPVYGGVAYEPQVEALKRGVEIVVGTPGRLLDLAKNRQLRLDRVRSLVLDEADRMLDLGFLDDVEKILAMLPATRQTMLFSATMPDPIAALARRFLHNPVTVRASHDANTGPSPLTRQLVYRAHPLNKIEVLARILQANGRGLTMIFTRTKRAADRVAEDLDFRGFAAAAVHGDLGQGARERALRAFRVGKIDVLVATDVAARGLDVLGVTHVINYDCPEDADAYVHRIGRTGRAGATGVAVTFVDWEDAPRWRLIEKTLGLDLTDPPGEPRETYHTSPHLYEDLDIPTGVTATLPAAERTRMGLAAEVLEDVEGKRGRRRSRSRSGGATTGGGRGPQGGTAGSAAGGTTRQRTRRRRRLDSADPDPATADATPTGQPPDPDAAGQQTSGSSTGRSRTGGSRRTRRPRTADSDAPNTVVEASTGTTSTRTDDASTERSGNAAVGTETLDAHDAPATQRTRTRRRRRGGRSHRGSESSPPSEHASSGDAPGGDASGGHSPSGRSPSGNASGGHSSTGNASGGHSSTGHSSGEHSA